MEKVAEYGLSAIEKSVNGLDYQDLQTTIHTNTEEKFISYQSYDLKPNQSMNYYRLRMGDREGNSWHSNTVMVDYQTNTAPKWTIFPNPVTNNKITLIGAGNLKPMVMIYDAFGKKVLETNNGGNQIDVSQLGAGLYVLVVSAGDGFKERIMVVIQK